MMPDPELFKRIANDLERNGYAIVPEFLAADATAALERDCRDRLAAAQMSPAAVGRGSGRQHHPALRGDRTCWFDSAALSPPQSHYWARLDELRTELNRRLLLGLDELEAHYACYPPGARYARHRDRFRSDDARVVSSVVYLNPDWNAGDGGALRLYLPVSTGTFVDIVPNAGTLVLFLSADFEHEVLAPARDRLSIAGWFRHRAN